MLCPNSSCFTFWHLWHSSALTGFCFSSCSHLWLLNGAGESPDFSWEPNSSNQIHFCGFVFGFYFWLMKTAIPALLTVILVALEKNFSTFFSFPRYDFCFQYPVVQMHFAAFLTAVHPSLSDLMSCLSPVPQNLSFVFHWVVLVPYLTLLCEQANKPPTIA